jgi:hypothetical protein
VVVVVVVVALVGIELTKAVLETEYDQTNKIY